jgi:putative transposase
MRDNFATLSDGEVIDNPKFLKNALKKLEIENQKLSRKKKTEVTLPDGRKIKKYSKRGEKQCLKVHKAHRKIRNKRQNFLHQKSYHVITKHDGIGVETLSIKDMLTGEVSNINRAISDVSWGSFVIMLEYKAKKYGKYFVKIDRFIPTTQMCNKCKHTMKLSIDQREYVCEVCGHREGRDSNSSKNVRDEAIKLLYSMYGSTAGTAGSDARTLSDEKNACTISTGSPLL